MWSSHRTAQPHPSLLDRAEEPPGGGQQLRFMVYTEDIFTQDATPQVTFHNAQYFLHCGQTRMLSAVSLLLTRHGGKVRSCQRYFSSNKIILSACFIIWQKMFLKCFSHPTVYKIEKTLIRIKGLASVAAPLSSVKVWSQFPTAGGCYKRPLPEGCIICDTSLPHVISAIKRWDCVDMLGTFLLYMI